MGGDRMDVLTNMPYIYRSSFMRLQQAAKELFTGWAGTGPKREVKIKFAKNVLIFMSTVVAIHFCGDHLAI